MRQFREHATFAKAERRLMAMLRRRENGYSAESPLEAAYLEAMRGANDLQKAKSRKSKNYPLAASHHHQDAWSRVIPCCRSTLENASRDGRYQPCVLSGEAGLPLQHCDGDKLQIVKNEVRRFSKHVSMMTSMTE